MFDRLEEAAFGRAKPLFDSQSNNKMDAGTSFRKKSLLPMPPWVPDEESKDCSLCKMTFSTLRRKHHCRNCGNIYCDSCSSHSLPLPHKGLNSPVRICDECFEVANMVLHVMKTKSAIRLTPIIRTLLYYIQEGKVTQCFIDHGGIDCLLYVLREYTDFQLQALLSSAFAILAAQENVRPSLVAKGYLQLVNFIIHLHTTIHLGNIEEEDRQSILNFSPTIVQNIAKSLTFMGSEAFSVKDSCEQKDFVNTIITLLCIQDTPLFRHIQTFIEPETFLDNVQECASRALADCLSKEELRPIILNDKRYSLERILSVMNYDKWNVIRYIAKSVAYLSVNNDSENPYKVRIVLSLLGQPPAEEMVVSPSSSPVPAMGLKPGRLIEIISRACSIPQADIQDHSSDNFHLFISTTHLFCTLGNLTSHRNARKLLLSGEPGLIELLCKASTAYPKVADVQKYLSRILANIAESVKYRNIMLSEESQVVDTLSHMIIHVKEKEIQKQVIRALDYLASKRTPPHKLLKIRDTLNKLSRMVSEGGKLKIRQILKRLETDQKKEEDSKDNLEGE